MEKESLAEYEKISFTHNRYIRAQNKNSNYLQIYYNKYFKGKKGKTNYGMYAQTQAFIPIWIIHFL